MIVKKLIELLEKYPENMDVLVFEGGEFDYAPLEEIKVKNIVFSETNGEKTEPFAEEKCLILEAP